MNFQHDWPSIQSVTPTLSGLLGTGKPELCESSALEEPLEIAEKVFNGLAAEKCLVFAPDALGNHLYSRQPSLFEDIVKHLPVRVQLLSVMPTFTPVCFASMFTGAPPVRHGISKYEKPVVRCDTLFDVLVREGKSVAIVAVTDSSIDQIFRDRDIDYFSEKYDPEVTERTIALLENNKHDFILAYHQEYDDTMHDTTPFDEKAIQAARNHVCDFVRISKTVDKSWSRYDRVVVFAPDHGAHLDSKTGRGSHGENIPEDMELYHFYGFRKGEEE